MFTLWSQTLSNFKLSPNEQVITSICRLYLPLKLTYINKQIVDRHFLSHFSVQASKKHVSFSCILLKLELLSKVFTARCTSA